MKSVILSNTAKESKSFWDAWVVWIKDKGFDFIQVDRPVAKEKDEVVDPNADYTKESELKALCTAWPLVTDHKVQTEVFIQLSCTEFHDKYLADDAEFGFDKFLEQKGELNINSTLWADPTTDDTQATTLAATRVKRIKVDVQIKNNAFVKQAPTTKTFNLLSKTDTLIKMRILNKTTDVPYCDSFGVEEEWMIGSLPNAKSCVLRITMGIVWYKSTMMKSIIQSNTVAESAKSWAEYKQWITVTNGH